MVAVWITACFVFCLALGGCSSSAKRSAEDLCTFRLGARGALVLDWGESYTCEVDPNEEKTKGLHNVNSTHKDDDMGGMIALKGTWKF